jgi:hypothetical protein
MAGAGAKKFPAFSKLTSDDVNNYLADQVIMRFATTTARDAAFGGVGEPTLAEGMTAYIDADNTIYTYDGSNWVKMISAAQPPAMELIKTQTIGTAVSSVPVADAFSSQYDNYKITVNGGVGSATQAIAVQLTGSSTGYYGAHITATYSTGVVSGNPVNNAASWSFVGVSSPDQNFLDCDIISPQQAKPAGITGSYMNGSTNGNGGSFNGYHASLFQATGFTLIVGGTMTGGTIRVYGYRN